MGQRFRKSRGSDVAEQIAQWLLSRHRDAAYQAAELLFAFLSGTGLPPEEMSSRRAMVVRELEESVRSFHRDHGLPYGALEPGIVAVIAAFETRFNELQEASTGQGGRA